jgi:CRP-like cAMP-binding protein
MPRKQYLRMLPALEPVTLKFGEVLYEPGQAIGLVYFPGVSLVSLLTLVDHRLALEVGMVGPEGMVGLPLALGVGVSPFRALVQGAGAAMQMKAAHFLKELQLSPQLQHALQGFTYNLMAQVAQTAACNRFHVVEERLARWLLMTGDRIQSDDFLLTQEFVSHMLGVRRVGVTKAAGQLQKLGLIEYSRGRLHIIDRSGLEAASCSCYRAADSNPSDLAARRPGSAANDISASGRSGARLAQKPGASTGL